MTVAHTARKQSLHLLSFLTACCRAQHDHSSPPSLFTAARVSAGDPRVTNWRSRSESTARGARSRTDDFLG